MQLSPSIWAGKITTYYNYYMYILKSTYDTGNTCTQEQKNREIVRMARKLADRENEPQETNLNEGDSQVSLERDSQISGKTHLSTTRQISNDI